MLRVRVNECVTENERVVENVGVGVGGTVTLRETEGDGVEVRVGEGVDVMVRVFDGDGVSEWLGEGVVEMVRDKVLDGVGVNVREGDADRDVPVREIESETVRVGGGLTVMLADGVRLDEGVGVGMCVALGDTV